MKKFKRIATLCLMISILASGCHYGGQETESSTQENTTETEFVSDGSENAIDDTTKADTEAPTEEIESEKDVVLNEIWLSLLQEIETYTLGQDMYQVSACILDFDPEYDSEIRSSLYYNRSKVYTPYFVKNESMWSARYDGYSSIWSDYSESIYQGDLNRSICVLDCRIGKEWNKELTAKEKKDSNLSVNCHFMLGVFGCEFLKKNGNTEGRMNANLYLMEYPSKSEIGFWICMEGEKAAYVTADIAHRIDFDTDYQIDRTKEFTESEANQALLKIKIEMTSGKPNIEGYWQVEAITDFEKLPGGYGVTFLEPTDIDGDGLLEEIRHEQGEDRSESWFLYTGNGEKNLLYLKKYAQEDLGGIYFTDVTGDNISDIVVKNWVQGAITHGYYSIWTSEEGVWKRIPLIDNRFSEEYSWMNGNFENLYLKSERLNETQMRVSTVGTDCSEVIELNPEVLDEIWAKDVGKVVWLTVVDGSKSDIRLYGDLMTGETRLGAAIRFGLAELSGRLIYEDGQWSLREINVRQAERVTPDFVAEAMADTEKWQKELWLSLLQDAIISVDGEIGAYTEENAGKTERNYRIPWTTKEGIENVTVDIFQYNSGYYLVGTGGYIATEDGYRWQSKGNEGLSEQKFAMSDIKNDANFIINVRDRLSQIGDLLKSDEPRYAARCEVAELLLQAAMRYAAEQQVEKNGSFKQTMRVRIYLLESNHDLQKPEGKLLLQFGDDTLFPIKVSYNGSCEDTLTGYTVEREEKNQPFYEVKEALCYDTTVKTTYLEEWKDTTWQVFLHYEENKNDNVSYGCFVEEPIVPDDYDGDGKTDRLFLMEGKYYLFLSRGEIFYLGPSVNFGHEHAERADVTGDGVDELLLIKGTMSTDGRVFCGISILKKTDVGMELLPFINEIGQASYLNVHISVPLLLERTDETHLKITQPACEKTVVGEFSTDELEQWGFSSGFLGPVFGSVEGFNIRTETDEAAGKDILVVKGMVLIESAFVMEVCWEMEYVDGVWKVIDFYLP